jgi:hypothetical protein
MLLRDNHCLYQNHTKHINTLKNRPTIFYNVTPCSPVQVFLSLRRMYCFHLHGRRINQTNCLLGLFFGCEIAGSAFLRNVDNVYQPTRGPIPEDISLDLSTIPPPPPRAENRWSRRDLDLTLSRKVTALHSVESVGNSNVLFGEMKSRDRCCLRHKNCARLIRAAPGNERNGAPGCRLKLFVWGCSAKKILRGCILIFNNISLF